MPRGLLRLPASWSVRYTCRVEDQAGGGYADEDIEGRTPMGRFAKPEDVARAVAFLADPEQSAFVNGHTLSVDGGWYGDGSWENPRRRKQNL
ncbi:MAG TPA: SDR family oxidoreductase [Rubrobacter sp.]|nr:SDR family oxidoreductase [Rubrobacter sp.]